MAGLMVFFLSECCALKTFCLGSFFSFFSQPLEGKTVPRSSQVIGLACWISGGDVKKATLTCAKHVVEAQKSAKQRFLFGLAKNPAELIGWRMLARLFAGFFVLCMMLTCNKSSIRES